MCNTKVPFKEKLAYGLGDAGCNFVWTTIGSFLTLYYTDSVGISAAVVGTIMLLTRLLDGLTDLGMGAIIDRTNTKQGKARPWIFRSSFFMAIGLILVFNVPVGLSMNGKIAYAFITYVFMAAIAYTASNLAYNTLLSLVTNDQGERTSMSTIRFICTMITVIIISSITMPLVSKIGWKGISLLYGVLSLVFLLITYFGTKERYVSIKDNKEKIGIKKSFKILFNNKYFVYTTFLFILIYATNGVSGGVAIYYVRNVLGNVDLFGLISISTIIPIIIGLFAFPKLSGKFGKWKCMVAGCIIQILGLVILISAPTNVTVVITATVIKGIGSVPNTAGLFALVADVVDYGEWKTYERIDGLTYSATSFGMKVGSGIGSALVGWILALGKYSATSEVQHASALFAMKALYAYIPLILTILTLIILLFTNIDRIYPTILKDLEARRQKAGV